MPVEGYNTIGQRLRYFREKEIGESRGKFIQGLNITARTLERYENDESVPDGSFLTKLNSKYRETINLDWLLTGRGSLYLQKDFESQTAQEEEGEYYDLILERMHKKLDRIYKEKDFSKLAAIQSLLNLADPEKDRDE